jgi:hypothetical protein
MKRTLTFATLIAIAAAAYAPLPSMAQSNFNLVVRTAPPAPLYERVPAPRHGFVWAAGHWEWRGQRHFWVPGVWIEERPGYAYAPASWSQRDGGWYMEPARWSSYDGRDRDRDGIPDRMEYRGQRDQGWHEREWREREWRREHDRDHDGIPNRYDRDRDGDGVPNRYDREPDNRWRN